MNMDKIEEKLEKNTEDISKLTGDMRELVAIVKGTEKRHDESMSTVKDAMLGIQKLLEKDISQLKESVTQALKEVSAVRHDLTNAINAQQALPMLRDDVVATKAKVEIFEKWKDEITGGYKAGKALMIALWTVGMALAGAAGFAISLFTGGSDGYTEN